MMWHVERQKKSLVRTNYIVVYDMMMMIHFNPLDYQILASHLPHLLQPPPRGLVLAPHQRSVAGAALRLTPHDTGETPRPPPRYTNELPGRPTATAALPPNVDGASPPMTHPAPLVSSVSSQALPRRPSSVVHDQGLDWHTAGEEP
jgi:hypothetical protein